MATGETAGRGSLQSDDKSNHSSALLFFIFTKTTPNLKSQHVSYRHKQTSEHFHCINIYIYIVSITLQI